MAVAVEGKRWHIPMIWIEEAPRSIEMIIKQDRREAVDDENGSEENVSL